MADETLPIVNRDNLEIPEFGLDDGDTRVQRVRDHVLAALDAAALELYGIENHGWKDSELPALFRALDAQAAAMLERAAAVIREREEKRNQDFRSCPILCSFIGTALQDLQQTESDLACEESREARDSGTVYTLPDSEFEKAQAICERFAADHAAEIAAALELVPGQEGLRHGSEYITADRIGSTLYLARVGSGVTFTDDGDAPALQSLADACRDVYADLLDFGDDGRVYGF